ncbi:MAG: Ig-like domain-containing protein [Gemmatimonadaceae bacterium]
MRTTMIPAAGRWLLLSASAAAIFACGKDAISPTAPFASPQPPVAAAEAIGALIPGFYWLSPIQPMLASYPGTFDGARSPTIDVCRWNGTACVGPVVATFSRTAGTISVDNAGQLYRADWTTAGLAAGVNYRIQVSEQATLIAFADARVPAVGETPAQLTQQGIVPLGNSSRLPMRFRLERVAAAPTVTITSPATGSVFPVGSPITLTGTASDPVQGNLSAQIVWQSSQVSGALGTGASISPTLGGGRHTITASVTNSSGITASSSIQVVVSIVSLPATLNVPYGGTASLPITLTQGAPVGGITFTVSSAAPGVVGVTTTTVTIPAGQQSANATVQGVAPGTAAVTVSNVDYGSATSQVSTTANLNIVQTSVSFAAGRTDQISIALESQGADIAAPPGGIVVTLVAANPACVAAPSTVTIPAGLVSVVADFTYGGTAATPCTTQVTASVATIPAITGDAVSVTVSPSPTMTFNLGESRLGAGLRGNLSTIFLAAPAPAGGVTVALTSSNAGVLLVSNDGPTTVGTGSATLSIAAGASSASFYMHGNNGAAGTATLSATAPGYATETSTPITVASTAIDIVSLPTTTTTLTPDDEFQLRIGVVDAAGPSIYQEQQVRPGGTPIVATVTNSNASAAQLTTTAGSAQSRSVSIVVGQSRSATTVAAGGIAFDPINAGTTTVTATAPNVVATTAASQVVTITAPNFTFSIGGARVGAGLRSDASSIFLGAPAPAGGLTITLASSSASVLLVSDDGATTVGTGTATLSVPAGATYVSFYMHGNNGAAGSATVSASATGYTTATSTAIDVASAAVDIISLPTTTTTLSLDDEFQLRIGVVDAAGTSIYQEQQVRPGTAAIGLTVTNSNAAVARLTTTAGSAQSRSVPIGVGQSRSATTVAAGGIAFDPINAGTTTVAVAAPNVVATTAASQVVTITAPNFTFSIGGARVGAGLRSDASGIFLGAPAPAGGLTVTLASSSASVLLVSDDGATTVGTGTATLSVPAGATYVSFYMHGNNGAAGTATVTASATGYTTTTSAAIDVASAAVEIVGLYSPTTTLSPDDDFVARIGVVDPAGTSVYQEQTIRPGGSAVVVTMTNSNSAVARLTTSSGSGQSRTVSIPVGQSRSPNDVAAGGIAFDPLAAGTTTITAAAPNLVTAAEGTVVMTIDAPTFTVNVGAARVGAGLRSQVGSIYLGAPAPAGGLAVTLTSSNASVMLVSDDGATTVGTGSAVLNVSAGSTVAFFYLHGVEGAAGTVTVTASAPGFTDATASATVAAKALDLFGVPTSTTAGAADNEFIARIGVVDAAGTSLFQEQEVRPGGTTVVVTLTNSNAAVARLTTSAGSAQSRTVSIASGNARSPGTVAAGGVAFDPLAAGNTTVAGTASGVVVVTGSSIGVTVTP